MDSFCIMDWLWSSQCCQSYQKALWVENVAMVCWKGCPIIILSFSWQAKDGGEADVQLPDCHGPKKETWRWGKKKSDILEQISVLPYSWSGAVRKIWKCCLQAYDSVALTRTTPRQRSVDPINSRVLRFTHEPPWRLHGHHECHWPFHIRSKVISPDARH